MLDLNGLHYTLHRKGLIQAVLDENGQAMKAGTKPMAGIIADVMETTVFSFGHVEPEDYVVTNKRAFPALNHENAAVHAHKDEGTCKSPP